MKLILLLFIITSCTNFALESQGRRDHETKINAILNQKSDQLKSCFVNSDLIVLKRIRVTFDITFDSKGLIKSFKTKKTYSHSLSKCLFNTVDLASYPQYKNDFRIIKTFTFSLTK